MHQPIKSFVLRKGRTSPRQQLALDTWLKDYELALPTEPWNFNILFPNHADIIVEIGFGMGQSLTAMAKANPETLYLGIEVHRAGIGSLAADLHDHKLTNVRIIPHDAVRVFEQAIPDGTLAGVQIFFPDPWPKKRHHKRRLIQVEFIQKLIPKLRQNGLIHVATDWEEYALEVLELFSATAGLKNTAQPGEFAPRPDTRPLTKFESRGQRLGHGVWDIIFVRV